MLAMPSELLDPAALPLDPQLLAALQAGGGAERADLVAPDVYALRLVTSAWCAELADAVASIERRARASGRPVRSPNSMHAYGVLAADLGLDPLLSRLVREVVRPLAAALYPEVGGATLDDHHGFVVHYGDAHDRDLALHVDDSDVTLNLCLGAEFEGGELLLSGRRCAPHAQTRARPGERVAVAQEPGIALLHAGMHRHEALPLASGERLNLIVWCRSRTWRAAREEDACPSWCGAPEGLAAARRRG